MKNINILTLCTESEIIIATKLICIIFYTELQTYV